MIHLSSYAFVQNCPNQPINSPDSLKLTPDRISTIEKHTLSHAASTMKMLKTVRKQHHRNLGKKVVKYNNNNNNNNNNTVIMGDRVTCMIN